MFVDLKIKRSSSASPSTNPNLCAFLQETFELFKLKNSKLSKIVCLKSSTTQSISPFRFIQNLSANIITSSFANDFSLYQDIFVRLLHGIVWLS